MEALDFLCSELISGDDTRAECASIKFKEYGFSGLEALRILFKSSIPDHRWWVIRSISSFELSDEIFADLLTGLEDNWCEVRQAAALAFLHRPSLAAAPALIERLSDSDPLTARLASYALCELGRSVSNNLLVVLNNGKLTARVEAMRALSEIKDTRTISEIMKFLEDDSALVQHWAKEALDKMGVGMVYLDPSKG